MLRRQSTSFKFNTRSNVCFRSVISVANVSPFGVSIESSERDLFFVQRLCFLASARGSAVHVFGHILDVSRMSTMAVSDFYWIIMNCGALRLPNERGTAAGTHSSSGLST
jgi:hypothetical protein